MLTRFNNISRPPVQMLAVVTRTKRRGYLEVVAFCDGAAPAGARPIADVPLVDTRCIVRKMPAVENLMLAAWFNQYDRNANVSQQALVALLEAPGLRLDLPFEVTPMGFAKMVFNTGIPVHLPTASISTKKKLYAAHWDAMRNLLQQYAALQEARAEEAVAAGAAEEGSREDGQP